MVDEQELVDYDETDDIPQTENKSEQIKDSHVSGSFNDFHLKSELLRAVVDCGFEHPSEVQYQALPQAILGTDILCQARAGTGKTTVFVLATLQQLQPIDGQVSIILICPTRELAYSISSEYKRLCRYMSNVKISVFFGGIPIKNDQDVLKNNCPHIVLGTPGRILALAKMKALELHNIKHFIIDICDHALESVDMRRDIQEIFKMTPREKQVLMFSTTLNKVIQPVCRRFMQEPLEIYINYETKSTLNNLCQHYVKLYEHEKTKKLIDLLDKLEFNQIIIFVKSTPDCISLCKFLLQQNFPAVEIHGAIAQQERLTRLKEFQEVRTRILVTTNLLGRGINFEHVNIILNYDMPEDTDIYLHRATRTGRFGTKGLVITFVSSENDTAILNQVQSRFVVHITEMPNEIDVSKYK